MLTENPNERFFIDSNILIYSYDRADPHKQSIATALIANLLIQENAVVSAQVLGEFFTSATRRIPQPLTVEEALAVIDSISSLPVIGIDATMVRRAIATHGRYGTTYWDSLIIAAAESADCTAILSEDYNSGQSYHGIVAINPFAAESI